MQISVNITPSQIAALIAGSSNSLNINWCDSFNDALHLFAKVRNRASHDNFMIFGRYFSMRKWFQISGHSRILNFLGVLFGVVDLKDTVFNSAEIGAANLLILIRKGVMHNSNTWLSSNAQTDQYCNSRQISCYEVTSAIEGIDPNSSICAIK